jgi:hypothetical protein
LLKVGISREEILVSRFWSTASARFHRAGISALTLHSGFTWLRLGLITQAQ